MTITVNIYYLDKNTMQWLPQHPAMFCHLAQFMAAVDLEEERSHYLKLLNNNFPIIINNIIGLIKQILLVVILTLMTGIAHSQQYASISRQWTWMPGSALGFSTNRHSPIVSRSLWDVKRTALETGSWLRNMHLVISSHLGSVWIIQ